MFHVGRKVFMNGTKITLFERTGNVQDMIQFRQECLDSKLFKVTDKCAKLTDKTDVDKEDLLLVTSNLDDFLTVWARHERKGKNRESASYGIRIKTELAKRISAIGYMCNTMKTSFNDNSEYRITLYSLDDVRFFLSRIFEYTQAHRISQQTKQVTAKEVISA